MSKKKKFSFHAAGEATFYIEVEAENEEIAKGLIEAGNYKSEQIESWVNEVEIDSIEEVEQSDI